MGTPPTGNKKSFQLAMTCDEVKPMLMNLDPFLKNKNYRLLYLGQFISFMGSMMTYMAIPYQLYQITHSSFQVGLIGVVQFVPLLVFSLLGGAYADSFDRKKMLVASELILSVLCLLLLFNASLTSPQSWVIYLCAAVASGVNGFHRPAMEALTPQIVSKDQLTSVAALNSFKFSVSAILGPTLSGLMIASGDIRWAYGFDFLSFFVSVFCLLQVQAPPFQKSHEAAKNKISSILEGIQYARKRPELMGTYFVDVIAMIFAMPMALYPAMAEEWGGATAAGWLYAALPTGALVVSILSGWTKEVSRHGAAVIVAALFWGVAIVFLAFAPNLYVAFFCLVLAGGFDMVSAIFRSTIWNETIPQNYRGRLAGMEMLSYMSGPMIGNARAGYVASISSKFTSILSGGILCVIFMGLSIYFFPKFWSYRSDTQPQ